MAKAALVPSSPSVLHQELLQRPSATQQSRDSPSRHTQPCTQSMDDQSHSLSCRISEVIHNSRKLSTRISYGRKWHRFSQWLLQARNFLSSVGLSTIFEFLLSLKDSGLLHSSIRVYLAAILAYHDRIDGFSPFSHPLAKRSLNALLHFYPPVKRHAGLLDLLLVPCCLTCHLFKPAAKCDIRLLPLKTLFLVVITWVHRVSELITLDIRPPFLTFLPHAIKLSTNISFLLKVVSKFHTHQDIVLPDFYPEPQSQTEKLLHTLDITRALKFYFYRTQYFNRDSNLFVSYS